MDAMPDKNTPTNLSRRTTLRALGSAGALTVGVSGVAAANEQTDSEPDSRSEFAGEETDSVVKTSSGNEECYSIPIDAPIDPEVCVEWEGTDGVYVTISEPNFGELGSYHLTPDEACYHANDLLLAAPSSLEVEICADFDKKEIDVYMEYCAFYGYGCVDGDWTLPP